MGLDRLTRWLRARRGDFPGQAAEREMAALRLILAGDDSRYQQIIGQMERAPEIERSNPTPETFRVGPTSTFDDLSFPLELERVASEWLPIEDSVTGRMLEFRVVVGRHGFLRGLEGRAVDGLGWPQEWQPRLPLGSTPWNVLALPSIEEQARIQEKGRQDVRAWLGAALPDSARVFPPAREVDIARFELRVGGALPARYREFLQITDGLDLVTIRINGIHDVYKVDHSTFPGIVIAWDSDDDDFIVVLSHDGGDQATYRINVHDPEANPVSFAADFREYLLGRIAEP
jgi:hypothetical protein